MKIRYVAYFLIMLGIIVFCLAMTVWAYKIERILVDLAYRMGVYVSLTDLDTFLGLSIFAVGLIVLGLIIWVDSVLPPEKV